MSRDFRLLLAGQALSWLGNGFQTVALAVAVLLTGGGAGELGFVLSSNVLALLAGSLLGGVWGDRLQPRRVMALSDLVRAATVGAMAVLYALGRPPTAVLCVLVAATAVAGSFFGPAMSALRPAVVTVEQRQAANAALSMVRSLTSVLGPIAGGATVAALGPSTGFAVNAATYLVSVVTVLLVRTRLERVPSSTGVFVEMRDGWAAIRERDWLLAGVLAAAAYHVVNGVVMVLAQVVAVRELGGARSVGMIAAAEGLGGILGGAAALRLKPKRLLLSGWSVLPLMSLWVLSYVVPGTLTAVLVGATIGWAGLIFYDVCWETAIQDRVPQGLLARVTSWDMAVSFVGMPVGNLMAGPLASWLGIEPVLLGAAVLLLFASLSPLLAKGTRTLTRPSEDEARDEADVVDDGFRIEYRWKEQVIYWEGDAGFLFDAGWGAKPPVLYVPSSDAWYDVMPPALRDRREEIVERLRLHSGHEVQEDVNGYYRPHPADRLLTPTEDA